MTTTTESGGYNTFTDDMHKVLFPEKKDEISIMIDVGNRLPPEIKDVHQNDCTNHASFLAIGIFVLLCTFIICVLIAFIFVVLSFVLALLDYGLLLKSDSPAYFWHVLPWVKIIFENIPKGVFLTSFIRSMMFLVCLTIFIIEMIIVGGGALLLIILSVVCIALLGDVGINSMCWSYDTCYGKNKYNIPFKQAYKYGHVTSDIRCEQYRLQRIAESYSKN